MSALDTARYYYAHAAGFGPEATDMALVPSFAADRACAWALRALHASRTGRIVSYGVAVAAVTP